MLEKPFIFVLYLLIFAHFLLVLDIYVHIWLNRKYFETISYVWLYNNFMNIFSFPQKYFFIGEICNFPLISNMGLLQSAFWRHSKVTRNSLFLNAGISGCFSVLFLSLYIYMHTHMLMDTVMCGVRWHLNTVLNGHIRQSGIPVTSDTCCFLCFVLWDILSKCDRRI